MKKTQTYKNLTIIKTIGDEGNVLIKDCPVLIPKENIDMFMEISQAADDNAKQWEDYPNSYKKKIVEKFVKAANYLNEKFDFNNISTDNKEHITEYINTYIKKTNFNDNLKATQHILDIMLEHYTTPGHSVYDNNWYYVFHYININNNYIGKDNIHGILRIISCMNNTNNFHYFKDIKSALQHNESFNEIDIDSTEAIPYIKYCQDKICELKVIQDYFNNVDITELYIAKDNGIIIFYVEGFNWCILITNCINYLKNKENNKIPLILK